MDLSNQTSEIFIQTMKTIIRKKGLSGLRSTVSDLLEKVIRNASKNGRKYIEATGYTTFLYGERQMNSILAPAFHKYTDAMILEYPATRKIGTKNHPASRADYYCLCNKSKSNSYRLFVELKSSWQRIPLTCKGFNARNKVLYSYACRQIRGLVNEFKGANRNFYETYPIMRVSMLTIALTSNPSRKHDLSREDIEELIRCAWNEFQYKDEMTPDLIGFWKTDKDLVINQEWENEDNDIQGIIYICHIMEPYRVKKLG